MVLVVVGCGSGYMVVFCVFACEALMSIQLVVNYSSSSSSSTAAPPPPDNRDALSELQPWQRSSNWSILLSNVLPQHLLIQTGSCVLYVKRRQQSHSVLSKRRDPGSGYTTMAANLVKFDKLGKLPITLQRLDEGQGVEVTMVAHQAKWHKTCMLQYNNTILRRAETHRKQLSIW